ncbi:unnamed protein product, partial [marine sediment metagenome]
TVFNDQFEEAVYEWENNPLYGWCHKNRKPDGSNYNLYRDGIKIYTTINSKLQQFAEASLREHLAELQETFMEKVTELKNPPFSDDLEIEEIEGIMESSIRRTDRYRSLRNAGVINDSILAVFNTPVEMTVFSWDTTAIDTVMSPLDSILYYKYFVRSGLMSMDPHTGYVKAYVGGPDFRYFKFDAVKTQKRQVGSTIKPFLYTLAMQDGYSPCYKVPNVPQIFKDNDSTWTPASSGRKEFWGKMVTLKWGLANSENYVSAWLMK